MINSNTLEYATRGKVKAKSVSAEASEIHNGQLQQILDKMDENKRSADNQYNTLMTAVSKINTRLDAIESDHRGFITSLEYAHRDVTDLKAKFEELNKQIQQLQANNEDKSEKTQAVIHTVDKIENDKNQRALLIANIPESRNESTTKIVLSLASHLDTTISPSDIDAAFRIKNESSPDHPVILVKFNNTTSREKLYNARKNFKKKSVTTKTLGFREERNIFINEMLSTAQQKLFYKARKQKKVLNWKYA